MNTANNETSLSLQTATLAGGCFWCLEAVFNELVGVQSAISGYTGGQVRNPSYQAVCAGTTGHAEAVQVTFDPGKISYQELLEIFFTIHDPTTLNRQGADVGTQYRSAIFYHDPAQQAVAEQVIRQVQAAGIWPHKIVTELAAYQGFYTAEGYHQEYYRNNQQQPYCQIVISPKVAKFRKQYFDKLKRTP